MALDRQATVKKAEGLAQAGKLDAAGAEYSRVLEEYPDDWSVANTLGDLYVRAGRRDRAAELFSTIGDRFCDKGFVPKAVALYKKALKAQGGNEHALSSLARVAVQQELFADARLYLGQLLQERRARQDADGVADCEARLAALPDRRAASESARAKAGVVRSAGSAVSVPIATSSSAPSQPHTDAAAAIPAAVASATVAAAVAPAGTALAPPTTAEGPQSAAKARRKPQPVGAGAEGKPGTAETAGAVKAGAVKAGTAERAAPRVDVTPAPLVPLPATLELEVFGQMPTPAPATASPEASAVAPAAEPTAAAGAVTPEAKPQASSRPGRAGAHGSVLTPRPSASRAVAVDACGAAGDDAGELELGALLDQDDIRSTDSVPEAEKSRDERRPMPETRDAEAREVAALDAVARERAAAREAAARDAAARDAAARDAAARDAAIREVASRERAAREAAVREAATRAAVGTLDAQRSRMGALVAAEPVDETTGLATLVAELERAAASPALRFQAAAQLGRLWIQHGQIGRGVEWLERAAQVPAPVPEHGMAVRYDLGTALERGGRPRRALDVWRDLEMDAGGYRDVRDRIERLERLESAGLSA